MFDPNNNTVPPPTGFDMLLQGMRFGNERLPWECSIVEEVPLAVMKHAGVKVVGGEGGRLWGEEREDENGDGDSGVGWGVVGCDSEKAYNLRHPGNSGVRQAVARNLAASLQGLDHRVAGKMMKKCFGPDLAVASPPLRHLEVKKIPITQPTPNPYATTTPTTLSLSYSKQHITLVERVERRPPITALPGMAASITAHVDATALKDIMYTQSKGGAIVLNDQVSLTRLYPHKPRKTDFILVRRRKKEKSGYTILPLPKMVLVAGYSQPKIPVPSEGSEGFEHKCSVVADVWLRQIMRKSIVDPEPLLKKLGGEGKMVEAVKIALEQNFVKIEGGGYGDVPGRGGGATPVMLAQFNSVLKDMRQQRLDGERVFRLMSFKRHKVLAGVFEKIGSSMIMKRATQSEAFLAVKTPQAPPVLELAKMFLPSKDFSDYLKGCGAARAASIQSMPDPEVLSMYFTTEEIEKMPAKNQREKARVIRRANPTPTPVTYPQKIQFFFESEAAKFTTPNPLSHKIHLPPPCPPDDCFSSDSEEPPTYHFLKKNTSSGFALIDEVISAERRALWMEYNALYGPEKKVPQKKPALKKPGGKRRAAAQPTGEPSKRGRKR